MPVPVVDRRIDPPPLPRRHFALRDALVFMFACALYLSTLMTVLRLWTIRRGGVEEGANDCTWVWVSLLVDGTWVVFYLLYRKWGLRQALLVHYSGLLGCAIPMAFVAILAVAWHLTVIEETVQGFFRWLWTDLSIPFAVITYGAGIGTLISFPISVLMLVYLGLRRPSPSAYPRLGP